MHDVFTPHAVDAGTDQKPENQKSEEPHLICRAILSVGTAIQGIEKELIGPSRLRPEMGPEPE